ncbi:DnaJ C-terminal domain-containing protein [Candidatus Berkiella aquae]|uniref:Curved DNA-binding protein n=1 Tax=Candidatus Berkiella aquae TaxID=295108 RepID=A0A0Q9YMF4_9GAMM|nr:DnaJ C-terminal domain-containing protein [Candidatus Berkiella aquae]MCS5710013.1 DnaJ domain-containing protein [Candidatus Berkiella aquae]
MEFKDYYAVLGVTPQTSHDEMKKAFRKLARQYHPDVSKLPDAEQKFKEINEAWEVLKDPEKRAQYDALRQGGWQQQQAKEGFRQPQYDFYSGDHPEDYTFTGGGDFSDFFEQLFGHKGQAEASSHHPSRGKDIHAKITIPLEVAYSGGTQMVQLDARHPQSKTLQIKIPKGVAQGSQIRLKGQGHANAKGNHGDLYIEIQLAPHAFFTAKQKDIYLNLPIAPWEAALGATVAVPTLGGSVNLKIQPGSQTGQKMRLKERGLPGNPAGDQYVVLEIKVPQANNEQAKALYEKMAQEMAFNPRAALGV